MRSTLAVNHVDVNSANPGLHTHADLLAQSVDPNPITGVVSHYSKLVSGVTEWFFQRENSGAVIQMSTAAGIPVANSNGRTFLPGGLILIWGICDYDTTSAPNQNFQGSGFPNNCFWMQASPRLVPPGTIAVTLGAQIVSATQFKINARASVSGAVTFSSGAYYLAIGN